jgi:hypothetical protein
MSKMKRSRKTVHSLAAAAKKTAQRSVGKSTGRPGSFSASAKRTSGRYHVVAKTRDGVFILRPKVKPKHFTSKQIREAIDEVEKSLSI